VRREGAIILDQQIRSGCNHTLFILISHAFLFKVCAAAVGVVGDLCRALNASVAPHCDEIMTRLLNNLAVCPPFIRSMKIYMPNLEQKR
jgi:hypothetical protein